MPPNTPAVLAPRRPRLARGASIAIAIAIAIANCATAGAVTIAIADDQPAPQVRTIAEPRQPVATRYFDIEANKATSMRALGRHIAEQSANHTPRYQDLEANKARSQDAR